MKTKGLSRVLLSLLVLVALTAGSAHGQVSAVGLTTSRDAQFCSTIETHADAVRAKISARQETVIRSWQAQTDKGALINQAQDSEIQQLRVRIDTQRAQNNRQLNGKAKSDAQKAAVQTYVAAVASAVGVRREAVDTARVNFRAGVKSLVQVRQAALAGQVDALRIGVSDAYDGVKSGCSEGVDPATVRLTLVQSLTAAKTSFADQRAADAQTVEEISKLSTAREQIVKNANTAFLQTTVAARAALRESFAGSQTII
jgi:hypothetical protein